MKRIQEKVKDLVEVRSHKILHDFISDPALTLSAYHFTDVTAEMMAKWLDKVADVQPQSGAAKALAGYRGVGKSHFLATLGAVVSHPELRSRITESFVAASAQRLKRKRYPVAYVRRGTHDTLLDEVKAGIAKTFNCSPDDFSDSVGDMLELATIKSEDCPFILIIDTAFDREKRVSRDDGVLLGELAEWAKRMNVFIGVALDDDIAGADGINAAIARNYTIDYLDQEHLYRIVESHVFPKYRQSQHLLHDLYSGFREVMPNFRWSEQRFTSLYPLHPVILETAPYVRLYAPEFAMLGFASEAGAKVLGRPANSLVALDEVFDRVENTLRKAKDLQEAFATYDSISADVIQHIPVMQRLQSKLILKALMILSLDGDGTTAGEISAAMLIYDEENPLSSVKAVEDLLETFVSIYPEQVHRVAEPNRETRFGLKVSSKDNLNNALNEAAKEVSPLVIEKVLRRFSREKFTDWALPVEGETSNADTSECQISWRGGYRRGRVSWNWERRGGASALVIPDSSAEFLDWEVIVCHPNNKEVANLPQSELPTVIWQPAALLPAEEETLRRYYVLLTNDALRESYTEQVRAAGHTHQSAVEKIWHRIFLQDGKLWIDGFQHSFTETALAAHTLSEMFSEMLAPLFEFRYQHHPYFEKNLGMNEVSQLVSEHFSGAKQSLPEVQDLAREFALPLGLVTQYGNNFILENEERLNEQPFAREVMMLVRQQKSDTVSLKAVYQKLKHEPYGLAHEAQHLVLAALVAQRQIEFVTSKGDRINRRSLDLKIIWDDIVGVAEPSTHLYGSAELTDWAKTLTGLDTFRTIDDSADCEKIYQGLQAWLANWKSQRLLERFDELPDEILNTKIWKIATRSQKTFGAIALTIEATLDKVISLEECLQRVADAFSDSEEEFFTSSNNLITLKDFVDAVILRQKVSAYLSVCEPAKDNDINGVHKTLLYLIEEVTQNPSESLNNETESLWQSFHTRYSQHYAIKHDTVMKSHYLQEKYDEIMRSDEWWEFENLSNMSIFQKKHWREAQRLTRKFSELDCGFDVREMLKSHPFCACSFRLSEMQQWENLPADLMEAIDKGRKAYRETLSLMRTTLVSLLQSFLQNEKPGDYADAAANLILIFAGEAEIRVLTNAELIVLGRVMQTIPSAPTLKISLPVENGFLSREELRSQFTEWLDKMPSEPCLLKI